MPEVFKQCVETNIKINIIQQCTKLQNNKLKEYYKNLKIDYELFNFTDNILEYYSKAELVITRSGSSVTAELINCKIPFISIPYPFSADSGTCFCWFLYSLRLIVAAWAVEIQGQGSRI